ncbi:MAG: ComF family protein [Thermoleophilaceae bacterium]|nr:ComF family protein [Thermoleophilaceae bacterium]
MILELLAPPLCWSCRAPAARGAPLCRACRRLLRFLGPEPVALCGLPVWAPVAYDGPAGELVKALKFHGAKRVAAEMAALIVANAPATMLAGTLVPVPLHPARRRARPFNQAGLIAEGLSRRARLPLVDCLRRTGPDSRQVGSGRAARLGGPAGSIHTTAAAPVNSLLVDDVVTTGATLAACAGALRAAGAERLAAVAFARTAGR